MPSFHTLLTQWSHAGWLPWAVAGVTTALVMVALRPRRPRRFQAAGPAVRAAAGFDDRVNPYEKFAVEDAYAGDRRASARRTATTTPVRVAGYRHPSEARPGWVVDRSTGGVCVAFDREVQPGQFLTLRAENAPDTTPWVQVEVRTARKATDDEVWYIGCRFVERPPWHVLLLFG